MGGKLGKQSENVSLLCVHEYKIFNRLLNWQNVDQIVSHMFGCASVSLSIIVYTYISIVLAHNVIA